MPKKLERKPDEYYKGKCRELEKRVRQLERQLAQYKKAQHMVDEAHEILMELDHTINEPPEIKKKDLCDSCHTGEMLLKFEFPDLNKKVFQCTHCGKTRSNAGV